MKLLLWLSFLTLAFFCPFVLFLSSACSYIISEYENSFSTWVYFIKSTSLKYIFSIIAIFLFSFGYFSRIAVFDILFIFYHILSRTCVLGFRFIFLPHILFIVVYCVSSRQSFIFQNYWCPFFCLSVF